MYKLNKTDKQLTKLAKTSLTEQGLLERFDLEQWLASSPQVLGESLLVLATEHVLPTNLRIDILALDRHANIVVVELKRDKSGGDIEWQSIKYASYCSNLSADEIYQILAAYLKLNTDQARAKVEEFIEDELDNLNQDQRIILVAGEFHSDVALTVLWLREYDIDVRCVRLGCFADTDGTLFLNPEVIIPLPEASDYITRREAKQQKKRNPERASFSLESGNFPDEELRGRLLATLRRNSELTPRFAALLDVLLSADRAFGRDEVKKALFEQGIGEDIGHAGRFLSNLSQYLTKKLNTHLRQVITFQGGSHEGEIKDQYQIVPRYRKLVGDVLRESRQGSSAPAGAGG